MGLKSYLVSVVVVQTVVVEPPLKSVEHYIRYMYDRSQHTSTFKYVAIVASALVGFKLSYACLALRHSTFAFTLLSS